MVKNCTSIEQSKKLLELGLNPDTADMWWNFYSITTDDTTPMIIHLNKPWAGNFNWNNEKDNVPAWSLSALLDLIPNTIGNYVLRFDKVDSDYYIWYEDVYKGWQDTIGHPFAENFIDAAFEMIVWLLKNKKL